MAITSLTDALTQINANLSWEGDVAKARLFLEAGRWLKINRAFSQGNEATSITYGDLQQEMTRAEEFLDARGVNRRSFTRGRPLRYKGGNV